MDVTSDESSTACFACCSSPPHVLPIKLLLLLWSPGICWANLLSTTGALYVLCAHNTYNKQTNKQTQQTMSTTCSARCSSPPQSSCLASLTSTFSVAPRFRFCIPSFVLNCCYIIGATHRMQSHMPTQLEKQLLASQCWNVSTHSIACPDMEIVHPFNGHAHISCGHLRQPWTRQR